MTDDSPLTAEIESFWNFSLATYCRGEVERLCLALQDEHGFDVNLLLLQAWVAARRQTSLDVPSIQALRSATALWSASIVEQLRRVRRLLKFPEHYAVAAEEAVACREIVKSAEIEAERIAQHLLVRALVLDTAKRHPSSGEAASASFAAYAEAIDAPAAQDELDRLRDAIFSSRPSAQPFSPPG